MWVRGTSGPVMLHTAMPLVLLNKPFQVLSQFRDSDGRQTLANHVTDNSVYPAGRLDYDSEGLILLSDDGKLQARISDPRHRVSKSYWAQVDGELTMQQVNQLLAGVKLKDGDARATEAAIIQEPRGLWPRTPPIRSRKHIPTSWLDISITAGRNRQVRRMTAAAGIPTLRLIRHRIGPWALDALLPGETRQYSNADAWQQLRHFLGQVRE